MRILAPLLVLALLAVVAVRWAADPLRDRERAWIEGSWDLATQRFDVRERFVARLEGQLERYGDDPETRWFAARGWLKIGEVSRAIDAVWGEPTLAAAPGTAHRFGALLLRTLGFVDDVHLEHPRRGAVMASLVLAEGGDEAAATWLDDTIRDRTQGAFLDVIYGTFLYSTRDGALRVADALRARSEPAPDVLAALAALGPEPYPEQGTDLARLEEVVLSDADREYQPMVWTTACVALGRSEDARAMDVLAGLHRRLARTTEERARSDAAVVAAGLLAGGRWSMLEPLAPYLGPAGPRSNARLAYFDAVRNRLVRGDPEATDAWLDLWQALQDYPDARLTERVATGLLLRDAHPPSHLPVESVLAILDRETASPAMRAIAAAWRYRTGEPAGRDALLGVLRRLSEGGWAGDDLMVSDPIWISPVLTSCRALYLYDPKAQP